MTVRQMADLLARVPEEFKDLPLTKQVDGFGDVEIGTFVVNDWTREDGTHVRLATVLGSQKTYESIRFAVEAYHAPARDQYS